MALDSNSKSLIPLSEAATWMSSPCPVFTLSVIKRDISKSVAITFVKCMPMPYFDYVIHFGSACTDKTMTKCVRPINHSLRLALR